MNNFLSLINSFQSDAQALTFYKGRKVIGRLTYKQLREQVLKVACHLEQDFGVQKGDRILVLSPNRLEIPVLLLAIFCLGAIAVPLNPNATEDDWRYIAKHADVSGLIAAPDLQLNGYAFDFILNIEDLLLLPDKSTEVLKSHSQDFADELAIVLYTSGTTGNPKGVGLSQSNLLLNARSMALNFRLNKTTQFSVLPLYHAHALGFGLMTALLTSGHLVFTDKIDPFSWAEVIRNEAVVYTSVFPSLLPILMAVQLQHDKVPSLKALLVSSAPLTTELAKAFECKTSIPIIQGWGLSEYTNFACCLSLDESITNHQKLLFEYEVPSIGSPLEGTEVKIIDERGNTLGENQLGELCVHGHSLMKGYYAEPEATHNTLLEGGWLRTGDQGLYRLHGNKPVFFITGRTKELIIRNGEKFSPLAIEKQICDAFPELQGNMVVLGFNHQLTGEEIGAYIELGNLDEAKIRAELGQIIESLPLETRPKIVLLGKDPIPKTHTGKVQRRKLHSLYSNYIAFNGHFKIVNLD